MNPGAPKEFLRETDDEAVRTARTLIRAARYGCLAAIDPKSGAPVASRVGLATDADGAPLILISTLASHTAAIETDPRCSLLVGEPPKADPLASARISLNCLANRLERESEEGLRAARRYLNRHKSARLYSGFGDFSFFRLEPQSASLVAGFAKAYALQREHLLIEPAIASMINQVEQEEIDRTNRDQSPIIDRVAKKIGKHTKGWKLAGIDAEGCDLVRNSELIRANFKSRIVSVDNIPAAIVKLAGKES